MNNKKKFEILTRKVQRTKNIPTYFKQIKEGSSENTHFELFLGTSELGNKQKKICDIISIQNKTYLEIIPVIKKVKNKSITCFLENQVDFILKYQRGENIDDLDTFSNYLKDMNISEIEKISYFGGLIGIYEKYENQGDEKIIPILCKINSFLEKNDPFFSQEFFNKVCKFVIPNIFSTDQYAVFYTESRIFQDKKNKISSLSIDTNNDTFENNMPFPYQNTDNFKSLKLPTGAYEYRANIFNVSKIEVKHNQYLNSSETENIYFPLTNLQVNVPKNQVKNTIFYIPELTLDFKKYLLELNNNEINSSSIEKKIQYFFSLNRDIESSCASFPFLTTDEKNTKHVISLAYDFNSEFKELKKVLNTSNKETQLFIEMMNTVLLSKAESSNLFYNFPGIAEQISDTFGIPIGLDTYFDSPIPQNETYKQNKTVFEILYLTLAYRKYIATNMLSNSEILLSHHFLYNIVSLDKESTLILKNLESIILQETSYNPYFSQTNINNGRKLSDDGESIIYFGSRIRDDH